jgi:hypothetical protein
MTYTGNVGNKTMSVNIGTNGTRFRFDFNAYNMPDRFSVFLRNGTRIFTRLAGTPGNPSSKHCFCSSCKGVTLPNGYVVLDRPIGESTVRVEVYGYCSGTGWKVTVGCAKSLVN